MFTPSAPLPSANKNWLFIGDAQAGERIAIIYSVIERCRCRGIDPLAYLRDCTAFLPHSIEHETIKSRLFVSIRL